MLNAALTTQQLMLSILPSLGFYGLVHSWARHTKRKVHFFQDALNCAIVLQKSAKCATLIDFLQRIRTWKVSGSSATRNFSVQYVTPETSHPINEHSLVGSIEGSLSMLYYYLHKEAAGTLSSFGRQSVSAPAEFVIDAVDATEQIQTRHLTMKSAPVVGYHLEPCLRRRMWLWIQHIQLGYTLYEILYRDDLSKVERYHGLDQEKASMQFLIHTCTELTDRGMYVSLLAHTCLIFQNLDDVMNLRPDFIRSQCLAKDAVELSKTMKIRSSAFDADTKADIIFQSFSGLEYGVARQKTVRYTKSRRDMEFRLQTVRYKIFNLWFQFLAQAPLKSKVDRLMLKICPSRKRKSNPGHANPGRQSSRPSVPTFSSTSDLSSESTTALPLIPLPSNDICNVPTNTDHIMDLEIVFDDLLSVGNNDRWESLQLAPISYLKMRQIQSSLFISAKDKIYEVQFSNPDFYSASGLVHYEHWRTISCMGSQTEESTRGHITVFSQDLQSIDATNVVDVVRPGSGIFRRCRSLYRGDIVKLFKFVLEFGDKPRQGDDIRRSLDNRVLEIGIYCQTGKLYNIERFEQAGDDATVIKQTVASLMDFLWQLAREIQITAERSPIGGNVDRDRKFGRPFRDAMGAKSSLFHCLTLVVQGVYPIPCQGRKHKDVQNDRAYPYSQTVCGNWYFADGEGYIYLFQILCNFRGAATSSFPYGPQVQRILQHIASYKSTLQSRYNEVFHDFFHDFDEHAVGKNFLKNPLYCENFFLHPSLPWKNRELVRGSGIYGDVITLPVGPSRTLSMSVMIDSIFRVRKMLSFDQILELTFFFSFYNNGSIVHSIMSRINGCDDMFVTENRKKQHPWYVFEEASIGLLGKGNWQAGIEPRFQCSSNTKWEVFYSNNESSRIESINLKLCKVLYIGYDLICWMNALNRMDLVAAEEIPFDVVTAKMDNVVLWIKKVTGEDSFDFGRFYLAQWLTLMIALGLPESGLHLLQLIIPSRGTASYDHFLHPTQGDMGCQNSQPIPESNLDSIMKLTSQELGFPVYFRTIMEVLGCESMGHRELGKNDVFLKGGTLFDINRQFGCPIHKESTKQSWKIIERPPLVFRLLDKNKCKEIERLYSNYSINMNPIMDLSFLDI